MINKLSPSLKKLIADLIQVQTDVSELNGGEDNVDLAAQMIGRMSKLEWLIIHELIIDFESEQDNPVERLL